LGEYQRTQSKQKRLPIQLREYIEREISFHPHREIGHKSKTDRESQNQPPPATIRSVVGRLPSLNVKCSGTQSGHDAMWKYTDEV